MAERRMFAKTIVDSDAFLDMPASSQNLYFHLAIRADDDGFINNPKKIQRTIGASDDDLKLLMAKRFLIPFDSGIVVIKHWRIHNYIRTDRYKPTVYTEEKAQISLKENGAYTLSPLGIPDDNHMVTDRSTQVRLGKDSIGKIETHTFKKPEFEEVKTYCRERVNGIDAQRFLDYYETRGWMLGKVKMKDWKAAVRTWEKNDTRKVEKPKEVINGLEDANFNGR